MSFYLAIVSPLDSPLFELPFLSARSAAPPSANSTSSSFPSWSTFTGANGSDLGPLPSPSTPHQSSDPSAGRAGLGNGQPGAAGAGGRGSVGAGGGGMLSEKSLCQMVIHKSLDSVEEIMDTTGTLYLRNIDKHNEWSVSTFIAGSVKFMLLHDTKNDDGIRLFFLDVWEAFVKVMLNPFHTVNTPIRNPSFEARIRASAKRNL